MYGLDVLVAYNFRVMPPRESILRVRMNDSERKEFKKLSDSKGLSESAHARMLMKEAIALSKQKERPPNKG